ncbi:MAG TPA: phospholipid carrier-dependent glycosyltransferase [Terracidiphilus sp.]|nr:phospholipid carrier-dependent glycosyltransferase [Terracidiphilus sp.]
MANRTKGWIYAAWMAALAGFAILYALHLRADFPNYSPWSMDWAKYTDEGWYGNAAIRAHLFGHWYVSGDFNPAVAAPVWPFLEWMLFFFTGVTVQAARGLAIAGFFLNLGLGYLLLRERGSRWMALLALTLVVTNPFVYCFSRLAILEPWLMTFTLAAMNLAVRLPRWKRPVGVAAWIGVLFTLMILTKTTAVFLLPSLGWAILAPLWKTKRRAIQCAAAAGAAFVLSYGAWMAMVMHRGLMGDYRYFFYINKYPRPSGIEWPFVSLWWSLHGGMWIDKILVPLAGVLTLGAAVCLRKSRGLLLDPVFGASVLAVAGYILFMTYQDHPQPRYFTVVALFSFFIVAMGTEILLERAGDGALWRASGWAVVGVIAVAVCVNGAWTLNYAVHPQYTFVNAADKLAQYMNAHPNGNRLLVSVSGDELTLLTHVPSLCDDFGTMELPEKIAKYEPGWFASWNDLDPGTLADLHTHYSLEQVAEFPAFDDKERNLLILFKLHPLPAGVVRDEGDMDLTQELPQDRFDASIE